ncbi:RNA polymerase sigma-70 factor [Prolixibacteraceae bacterium JC049]|nr:RNA polymerase sigma-70 factor [Prolixibacteraceae bacterium JC049]
MADTNNIHSNENLAIAIRAGQTFAFEYIFRKYYPRLKLFALRLLKDEIIAEDIIQDIFAKLWENRVDLDPNKQLQSFLFKSTRNACLNHLKHQDVEQQYLHALLYENTSQELFLINFLEEEELKQLQEEMMKEIRDILNSLSPQCRKAFELSRFNQLKNKEVAEVMQLNIKTVEKHIAKAMKTIKKELKTKPFLFTLFLLHF